MKKGFQERGSRRYLNLLVQTVPWENSEMKLSFTECDMRLKLHTEYEVKITKCFNVNEIKLLCYIYMYSVLSTNIRMNNFVSSRPHVLWKQSLCDSWFTPWLFYSPVLFRTPYMTDLTKIKFGQGRSLNWNYHQVVQGSTPLTCSLGPFLLNSGHWNHVPHLLFEDRSLLTPVSWEILAHGAPVLFFRWGGHQFGIAEFSQGFSDGFK